jgi:hypothetical protein
MEYRVLSGTPLRSVLHYERQPKGGINMVYQQFTVFDTCRIAEEIHAQLQRLTQDLTGVSKLIDLSVLPDLSYADLKHHHHPVCLLSEICRLLLKSGNKNFLQHCLALSHIIYYQRRS